MAKKHRRHSTSKKREVVEAYFDGFDPTFPIWLST